MWESKALVSLEAAAKEFLQRHNGGKANRFLKHVRFESTCENDVHCQRVLLETYGHRCNWPDITTLDASKEKSFCTTHQRLCPIIKTTTENRR